MIADAIKYTKRSKACQIHVDFIHQPLELLHPTIAVWPFEAWGTDIIGPISPPSAKGHRFILTITNYFSKWAEVVPFIEVKTTNVVNFIKYFVIHWFDISRKIIHNNGSQFASQSFYQFCNKYQIQNVASTAYNPTVNGLTEAFNRIIIKLLKKFISTSKRDWNEKLSECFFGLPNYSSNPDRQYAFFSAYEYKAVKPLEIQIPSLRVALATKMTDEITIGYVFKSLKR